MSWLVLFLLRLQSRFYLPDAAVSCLVIFLYAFLVILGTHSDYVARMVESFPKSLYCLRKHWKIGVDFVRFVVCPKCYSVFEKNKCMEKQGTQLVSKHCTYRDHPNSRKCCKAQLLKTVHVTSGKRLYPYKVYCYQTLISSLQSLLQLPGFSNSCEHWRTQFQSENDQENDFVLRDIYDGKIWRDFQNLDEVPFLSSSYTYALMLNLDWFQPYKLTQSSVGALYLTIMNLPYDQRFKRENIILLGIIPGPGEPKREVNQYLRPLVKELLELLAGVKMTVHSEQEPQLVRCALIGVPCDMPAGRKACGFLGHAATLGCTKCTKKFPGPVGNKIYSGFDRNNWTLRNNSDHRRSINLIKQAKNKTQRNKLESEHGCRYSVLLELPYFDPTRMLIIDPMHNLFLGTAKRIKNIWMNDNNPLFTSTEIQTIQDRVNSMNVPSDIGRIPRKIETKFSGLTADQYKNWVVLYSIPCLHGLLEKEHIECWRQFVLACRLLCKRAISKSNVTLADVLLLKFLQRVERVYGNDVVTPNMHMHLHLKDTLLDYGPVYGFWLFSYERYNGILEHQPTNNRSIEIQLMRRFLQDNNAYRIQPPIDYKDELEKLTLLRPSLTGSLLLTTQATGIESVDFTFPTSCTRHVFMESEVRILKKLMIKLKIVSEECVLNSTYYKYKQANKKGTTILSTTTKSTSIVMALWDQDIFGHAPTFLPRLFVNPVDANLRPVRINYFLKLSYCTSEVVHTHHFVCVSWFQPHPSRFSIGKPAQIWCKNAFEPEGLHSFLSLDRLSSRCIHTVLEVAGEYCLVVVPLIE